MIVRAVGAVLPHPWASKKRTTKIPVAVDRLLVSALSVASAVSVTHVEAYAHRVCYFGNYEQALAINVISCSSVNAISDPGSTAKSHPRTHQSYAPRTPTVRIAKIEQEKGRRKP